MKGPVSGPLGCLFGMKGPVSGPLVSRDISRLLSSGCRNQGPVSGPFVSPPSSSTRGTFTHGGRCTPSFRTRISVRSRSLRSTTTQAPLLLAGNGLRWLNTLSVTGREKASRRERAWLVGEALQSTNQPRLPGGSTSTRRDT